jgi:tetratricopeptide (TPR) repeat protein
LNRKSLFGVVSAAALCAAAAGASGSAAAAESGAQAPVIAPAPDGWVKPIDEPKPLSSKEGGAPAKLISEDIQVNLADGLDLYDHREIQLLTQEGLAAGNVQLVWNPDTDVLYVHHLLIRRGKDTIDVLASGQTFTVIRRETNLERAMLDGALTAMMQPEGLQVGDIVNLAYTVKRRDPTMRGQVESFNFLRPGKMGRLRIRYVWPTSRPVRWRKTSDMPEPKIAKTTAETEVVFDEPEAELPKLPELAPARYSNIGQIEVSGFKDWAEVSSLMAPLYDKAAMLGPKSALKAEAAKIAAASSDPKVRAAAALKLVQDRVRYLYQGMNFGAYVPADADVTWGRRFGDCKGKTALLLALLKELGVEAEPAFVSTVVGDGLDERLPLMEVFDHAIVRARIGGKTYWLDGTRVGDADLDRLEVPSFRWALPVQASGATLEKLVVAPLDVPSHERAIRLDATAGLNAPAPAHIEERVRGDAATVVQRALANMSSEDADKILRKGFEENFSWIEVKSTSFSYDPDRHEATLTMDGAAWMGWNRQANGSSLRYETDFTAMGSNSDFKRKTPGYDTLPYKVDFPSYERTTEVILLPRGGQGFSMVGADVDKTAGGVAYHRKAVIEKGVVTIESSSRAMIPEIAADQLQADKTVLRALWGDPLLVQGPVYWRDNAAEITARTERKPVTAGEFANRGDAWLMKGSYDKAMADFGEAIKLKPDDANFQNARCFARAEAGRELDAAMADCEAALKIAPKAAGTLDSRGLVWMRMGKLDEALKDYDAAIVLEPNQASSLFMRGVVKTRQGHAVEGEKDIKAALALDPNVGDDYAHFGIKP